MKNTHNLMKHFASVLRKRALGKDTSTGPDPTLIKYLSRKELISILLLKFGPNKPNDLNLRDLENEELLELIGDELFILAYFSKQWCTETIQVETVVSEPTPKTPVRTKKKGGTRAS